MKTVVQPTPRCSELHEEKLHESSGLMNTKTEHIQYASSCLKLKPSCCCHGGSALAVSGLADYYGLWVQACAADRRVAMVTLSIAAEAAGGNVSFTGQIRFISQ